MTNFLESCDEEIIKEHLNELVNALVTMIREGISIVKQNGVTALASLAEAAKTTFIPFYEQTINFLCDMMLQFNEPCYRQLKGLIIEAATIISASVGYECFKPFSTRLIGTMLEL